MSIQACYHDGRLKDPSELRDSLRPAAHWTVANKLVIDKCGAELLASRHPFDQAMPS